MKHPFKSFRTFLCMLPALLVFSTSNIYAQCVNCDNSYLNVTDNTAIEYDNIVSSYHSTISKQADASVLIWGEDIASNGTGNHTTPVAFNNTNYPALTGSILKFTLASASKNHIQYAVLTTDGLFVGGEEGIMVAGSLTTSTNFQKIFTAAQLPVTPGQVKMLFGTYQTLVILSCSGAVYVLSQDDDMRGNGSSGGSTTWSQVTYNLNNGGTSNDGNLSGIVAVRGCPEGLMAQKNDGTIWTWGPSVFLGNASGANDYDRARQMTITKPQGGGNIVAKMIGMTGSRDDGIDESYNDEHGTAHFILGTDGFVYSLGTNNSRQLGDRTTTDRTSWVRVKSGSGSNDFLNNIVWISPNEHDNYGMHSVNVLKDNGQVWAWGDNERNMLGFSGGGEKDPGTPPGGLTMSDIIMAVETGGHTTIVVKKCSAKFGYVGHRVNGSMADGSNADEDEDTYTFSTATLNICGAVSGAAALVQPGMAPYYIGQVFVLNPQPAGGTLSVSGPATLVGNTLTLTGAGNVTVEYTVTTACGTTKDKFTIKVDKPLPVVLNDVQAHITGGLLYVNWSTESESNNSLFEIHVSADGENFTKVGEVATKAANGTSSAPIQYEYTSNMAGRVALGLVILALAAVGSNLSRRQKLFFVLVASAALVLNAAGCAKRETPDTPENGKVFVKVIQVDINNKKASSKVVQATVN